MAIRRETDVSHFDAMPVSILGTATLDHCAKQFGDPANSRRSRVNLVINTTEPFVEETWVGKQLSIGDVRLAVAQRITRCRMIDVAQDGVAEPDPWLAQLCTERDVRLAVYATVDVPGVVTVGNSVTAPQGERGMAKGR